MNAAHIEQDSAPSVVSFVPGQRVEVLWDRPGRKEWLPGTFEFAQPSPEIDEDFERCYVRMDNGFACRSPGFHPACVRAA
jgi:hypothetical protein